MDDDSDSSVVEVEIPPKSSPLCISIEEDDVMLNVCSTAKVETNGNCDYIRLTENFSEEMEVGANAPCHWTPDMIRFYNDDWGDEESFVVHKIQESMDKNPDMWKISQKDILSAYSRRVKKCKIKCWNCCQYGHVASQCPDPLRIQKCFMCGCSGHESKYCPRSKCLNCGTSSRKFIDMCNKCLEELKKTCSRCKLQGHYFINCSDHWRRFHVTTSSEIKIPCSSDTYKPTNQLWCCNCGRKGHCEIKCRSKKNSPHFSETLRSVASYDDLYFNPYTENQKEENRTAQKRRYFEEEASVLATPEKPISIPTTNRTVRDEEVTVVYESNEKRRKNENNFKKQLRLLFNPNSVKKNKGQFKKRKDRGYQHQSNMDKWKDLFKHPKRKK